MVASALLYIGGNGSPKEDISGHVWTLLDADARMVACLIHGVSRGESNAQALTGKAAQLAIRLTVTGVWHLVHA